MKPSPRRGVSIFRRLRLFPKAVYAFTQVWPAPVGFSVRFFFQ